MAKKVQINLFEMYHSYTYHDGDGICLGDSRLYVIAKDREDAIAKFEPSLKAVQAECARRKGSSEKVSYTLVTLENLIVARDSSNDGRMGWHSTTDITQLELLDDTNYTLGICIIPK